MSSNCMSRQSATQEDTPKWDLYNNLDNYRRTSIIIEPEKTGKGVMVKSTMSYL